MKETGIIMSGDHPNKILDDIKSMTRRIYGLEKINENPDRWEYMRTNNDGRALFWVVGDDPEPDIEKRVRLVKCPYGGVGDLLWVRETWMTSKEYDLLKPSEIPEIGRTVPLWYWANGNHYADKVSEGAGKVRPSIHMPRWASRITLEITGLRPERLQEISPANCSEEGINRTGDIIIRGKDMRERFSKLWDSINGKWKRVWNKELKIYEFWHFPWSEATAKPIPKTTEHPERYHCSPNPWVWKIEF